MRILLLILIVSGEAYARDGCSTRTGWTPWRPMAGNCDIADVSRQSGLPAESYIDRLYQINLDDTAPNKGDASILWPQPKAINPNHLYCQTVSKPSKTHLSFRL